MSLKSTLVIMLICFSTTSFASGGGDGHPPLGQMGGAAGGADGYHLVGGGGADGSGPYAGQTELALMGGSDGADGHRDGAGT